MLEVPDDVSFFAEGSAFGAVCLVASVEVHRRCWDFHDGLGLFLMCSSLASKALDPEMQARAALI